MIHGTGEPPVEPPPEQPPSSAKWRPEDLTTVGDGIRPEPERRQQSELDGCLAAIGKGILILFIGIFVLGGLIFATCFLSLRR